MASTLWSVLLLALLVASSVDANRRYRNRSNDRPNRRIDHGSAADAAEQVSTFRLPTTGVDVMIGD